MNELKLSDLTQLHTIVESALWAAKTNPSEGWTTPRSAALHRHSYRRFVKALFQVMTSGDFPTPYVTMLDGDIRATWRDVEDTVLCLATCGHFEVTVTVIGNEDSDDFGKIIRDYDDDEALTRTVNKLHEYRRTHLKGWADA
jgi:hypothetical protein